MTIRTPLQSLHSVFSFTGFALVAFAASAAHRTLRTVHRVLHRRRSSGLASDRHFFGCRRNAWRGQLSPYRGRGAGGRAGGSDQQGAPTRLDAHLLGAGADDDAPRPGAVLLRAGPQEERAGRDDAVRLSDGADDGIWGLYGYSLAFGGDARGINRAQQVDRQRTTTCS